MVSYEVICRTGEVGIGRENMDEMRVYEIGGICDSSALRMSGWTYGSS